MYHIGNFQAFSVILINTWFEHLLTVTIPNLHYKVSYVNPQHCELALAVCWMQGIGCYMFRIDDYNVVDATVNGNAARFINHSCDVSHGFLITNIVIMVDICHTE